jgi:death on curing protein
VVRVVDIGVADSALYASAAASGDTESYPDFLENGGGPGRMPRENNPLPDGNERAAWIALRIFIEINEWSWRSHPTVDDAERAVLAIASGDWQEEQSAAWLRERLSPPA